MEPRGEDDGTHCCLVAIGRLQVTSTPNTSDMSGANNNCGKHFAVLAFLEPLLFFSCMTKWLLFFCRIYLSSQHGR